MPLTDDNAVPIRDYAAQQTSQTPAAHCQLATMPVLHVHPVS
ncbi:hypothetical protein [Streptomyces kanamyceticus]|nr:hypothetical protein [Streptomyces kanamyceticus]